MSRILRRPMFRGGRVDSRGTGITSGLANGGQIGGGVIYGELNPDGRYGFKKPSIFSMSGLKNFKNIFGPKSSTIVDPAATGSFGTKSGGQILKQAGGGQFQGPPIDPLSQAIEKRLSQGLRGAARNKFVQGALNRLGTFAGLNPLTATAGLTSLAFAPTAGLAYMNRPKTVEALEYMKKMNDSGVFDETAGPGDYEAFAEEFTRLNETGTPLDSEKAENVGLTSSQDELAEVIEKITKEKPKDEPDPDKDKPDPDKDKPDPNKEESLDVGADLKKTQKLFEELLGIDKARRRDVGDMLGRASAAFLGAPSVREGLADFMRTESATGPGRGEKIGQSAAALAINDYIQGKKSRADLERLLAGEKFKTDYRLKRVEESLTIDDKLLKAASDEGKSRKSDSVIQVVFDDVYGQGSFKGKLPKSVEDLVVGGIYVGDSEDKSYKIVYQVNSEGEPVPIKNIF